MLLVIAMVGVYVTVFALLMWMTNILLSTHSHSDDFDGENWPL